MPRSADPAGRRGVGFESGSGRTGGSSSAPLEAPHSARTRKSARKSLSGEHTDKDIMKQLQQQLAKAGTKQADREMRQTARKQRSANDRLSRQSRVSSPFTQQRNHDLAPQVDGNSVLPMIQHAMWSNSVKVKRDAVAGLSVLSSSEANKDFIGRLGGISALLNLVCKPADVQLARENPQTPGPNGVPLDPFYRRMFDSPSSAGTPGSPGLFPPPIHAGSANMRGRLMSTMNPTFVEPSAQHPAPKGRTQRQQGSVILPLTSEGMTAQQRMSLFSRKGTDNDGASGRRFAFEENNGGGGSGKRASSASFHPKREPLASASFASNRSLGSEEDPSQAATWGIDSSCAVGENVQPLATVPSEGAVSEGVGRRRKKKSKEREREKERERRAQAEQDGTDLTLQRTASVVLANLCTSPANQMLLVDSDGVTRVLAVLEKVTNPVTRRSLVNVVTWLCRNEELREAIAGEALAPLHALSHCADLQTRMYCFSAIRYLAESEDNCQEWAAEHLQAELAWLKDPPSNPLLTNLALQILRNLAQVEEHAQGIVENDGVHVLSQYLDMERYEEDVCMPAVDVYNWLASHREFREQIATLEVLLALRIQLEAHATSDIFPEANLVNVARLLAALADCGPNHQTLSRLQLVPVMFQVLGRGSRSKQAQHYAMLFLTHLSQFKGCHVALGAHLAEMIDLVMRGDQRTQRGATVILAELTNEPGVRKRVFELHPQFMQICHTLMGSEDRDTKKAAFTLVGNVVMELPSLKGRLGADTEQAQEKMIQKLVYQMSPSRRRKRDPHSDILATLHNSAISIIHNLAAVRDNDINNCMIKHGAIHTLTSAKHDHLTSDETRAKIRKVMDTYLKLHFQAVKIQTMIRGRLARQRAERQKRETENSLKAAESAQQNVPAVAAALPHEPPISKAEIRRGSATNVLGLTKAA